MKLKNEYMLDFHVDKGTNVIPLDVIKDFFQKLEYGSKYRIYFILLLLSLRPGEPLKLTWDNFLLHKQELIFRPPKQKKRNLIRRIKLPEKVAQELQFFRDSNFFPGKKIFNVSQEAVRKYFNIKLRPVLPQIWRKKSGNLRQGSCAEYYYFTQQSFRTTAATLFFYYYSRVYGTNSNLALEYTCKTMGHASEKITSAYYIQRISALNLDKFPSNLSYLQLMEHILYFDMQHLITAFYQPENKSLIEFDLGLAN